MFNFLFGSHYENSTTIKANSLESAIEIFKVQELYPEKFVDQKYIKDKEYNSIQNRYDYIFKDEPKIHVYKFPMNFEDSLYHNKKGRFVKKISLSECINVNFPTTKSQSLLEYSGQSEHPENENKSDIVLSLNSSIVKKDIKDLTKIEIRKLDGLVNEKFNELEKQRQELKEFADKLHKELQEKKKLLYVLETYLGIKEQIYQLQKGNPCENEEPLSIYQMKLYMDEEIGLWEDGGLDSQNIEKFDQWLLKNKNYKKFLYKEHSVCAFQIRREDKKYNEDVFLNAVLNQDNKKTYILIRNGDNLYRIWSNVHFPEKFFPSHSDFEKIYEEAERWGRDDEDLKNKVKDLQETHAYGFIAIQGLLERTQIFNQKVRTLNLFSPDSFNDERLNLIRDAEPDFWIGDGKPSWYDFITKNRKTIKQGTRIVISKSFDYFRDDDKWRYEPFRPGSIPSMSEIFIVEEYFEQKKYFRSGDLKVLYNSDDEIWERNSFDEHIRKKRVPFRLYKDEVINYDNITIEDCEYYTTNRYERKNYLSILPVLYYIKKSKIKEKETEDNLIKFLKPQIKVSISDEKIRKIIKWWKLKNKWKRDVLDDDNKAIRMILKKINKETK